MTHRPDPVAYLSGHLNDAPYPGGVSCLGEGGKFTPDGAVQPWPGNTFICHIPHTGQAFAAIQSLQERLKRSEFNRFFTYLPMPSVHMTVFQGISPMNEAGAVWPRDLPRHLGRDAVTAAFLARLKTQTLPQTFEITATDLFAAHSLTVTGATPEQEQRLRQVRKDLRAATDLHPAAFETYVFHITLAYPLCWMSGALAQEVQDFGDQAFADVAADLAHIALGPVELCQFETMHHFTTMARLT